jgi:hypothetical protein
MDTQMVRRPSESYLRQDYPTVNGALGGWVGTAPDEMAGSVLDPSTAAVRRGAEYGFPVGTALGMLPAAGLTKGLPVGMGIKPINLEKGIYRPELTMEEMLKVKDIPTVERVRKSMDLVGEKEFENMVNSQFKKYKPTDQDTEAMLVESVTLNILGKAQRAPYPQQAALDLAQQRAALPVSQGGLGLPAGNTAEQRAAAMGFDTDVYHGTTNDFDKFAGKLPTYAAEEPRIADIYANATGRQMALNNINAGPNIIPLKLGGKEFTVSDLGEGGGGWFRDNLAQSLGIPRTRNLINELPKYGIDRLKVTDMGDLGGVQTQHMIPSGSDNIRSRFAAFDPFRKTAAIAATMGVAAPDLLAAPTPASVADQIDTINEIIKKKRKK